MTNSMWVTLHILWNTVSCHLFLLPTEGEYIAHFVKAVSSHLFLWPTGCEWHCTLWNTVSSHLFLWPTACEWHCTFCQIQFHHIFSYYQQHVSDIAHFVKDTSFPITNRKWVTLHILWKAVSSHIFLQPKASEWYCTFHDRQSHHISSYDQQVVSDIAHFVKGSLITSFFLSPTGSEWHCTSCEMQSHHIFSYHQQYVSDIQAHFVEAIFSYHQQLVSDIAQFACHIFSYHQQVVSAIAQFVKHSFITSFSRMNFFPCLETRKGTLQSRYFVLLVGSTWLMPLQQAYWLPGLSL